MRISDWSSDVCSSDLADPARAEPAHHGEQLCDLVYVQAGSGFVEYQDACRQVDGTGNSRQVLHRDRKLAEWARYLDLDIEGPKQGRRIAVQAAAVDPAPHGGLAHERQVFLTRPGGAQDA